MLSLGLVVVFLWILAGYMRLEHLQFELDLDDASGRIIELSKDEFISAAINSAVQDNFDHTHVRKMCDAQEWDPTVVFTCHGIIGGIGKSFEISYPLFKSHQK
jgi:hypothetical protein